MKKKTLKDKVVGLMGYLKYLTRNIGIR